MHRPDDYIGFIPSCPLHILQQNCALVWNYCRVWCGQVSQHQQRMFAHFARLSPCTKTQSVTLTLFFVAQTVTTSVTTAGDFSLDLGFSCFIWGSAVFIENQGRFDSGQILEMHVVILYFPFKDTVVSQT